MKIVTVPSRHRQITAPQPHGSGDIPTGRIKLVGFASRAELDVYVSGPDAPGRFGKIIQTPIRFGGHIVNARGTTHAGGMSFAMTVAGPYERMECLKEHVLRDPVFASHRPRAMLNRSPGRHAPCARQELFVEVEDDPQVAEIAMLAGQRGINIASIEMRRVSAAFSGHFVAASLRLGSEFMIDIAKEQAEAFSHFKADLAEMDNHYGRLIRIWGPIQEGEPGERPLWKSVRHKA